MMVILLKILLKRTDLEKNSFLLYIKPNKENCGLEEMVFIVSMASLLKEYIKYKFERTTAVSRNGEVWDLSEIGKVFN